MLNVSATFKAKEKAQINLRKSLKNNKPGKTTDPSFPKTQHILVVVARAPTREADDPAKSNPDLRIEILNAMGLDETVINLVTRGLGCTKFN